MSALTSFGDGLREGRILDARVDLPEPLQPEKTKISDIDEVSYLYFYIL